MPADVTGVRYSMIARGLHWVSALIVLGLLPLGYYMTGLDASPFKLELYSLHKSFGTLLFFLVLVRLVWRFVSPPPVPLPTHAAWEKALAKLVHVLLYIGMIGLPLSGWLMASAGAFPHTFFGLFDMPDLAGQDEALFNRMRLAHDIGGYALIAAVILHGLGAFKHHFIDRDDTLARMLPSFAPAAGAAVTALVFAGAMAVTGLLVLGSWLAALKPAPVTAASSSVVAEAAPSAAGAAPLWAIIHEQSVLGFSVTVQSEAFEGQFTSFDGTIRFDPAAPEQSTATVSAAIASVQTGSAERDESITAPAWLDAAAFPRAVFTADSFERLDDGSYTAHGTLTLRDVSLPVSVPFTLDIEDNTARMTGAFTVPRLDFGIGTGDWAAPDLVGHEVTVAVEITAVRGE